LLENGPVDVLLFVLRVMGVIDQCSIKDMMKPKVLNQNIIYGFGYDWGGAIVLRIMAHLGIFKKGIGFMPAYG